MSDGKTIFEGLYQIDWESLQHVNDEPATGVPEALKDLLSNDPMIRSLARRTLFDEGKADWGVYTEASPYLVPFVCELLPFDAVEDRYGILQWLSGILVLNSSGRQFFASVDAIKDYAFMYSTVEKYLPVILTLLHLRGNQLLRSTAAEMLGKMNGNIETVVPELVAQFEIETEHDVQLSILSALKDLFSYKIPKSLSLRDTYAPFFRAIVESDLPDDLRYRGAYAGLVATRSRIGSGYIEENEISSQTSLVLQNVFWRSYLNHRNAYDVENRLLEMMLLPNAISVLWDMLHDPRLHADDQQVILRALLHVRFQRRWSLYYPQLGPRLTRGGASSYNHLGIEKKKLKGDPVLKDIVNDDSLWHHQANIFSYFLGLPDSREELRAFLNTDKDQS